LLGCIGLLARKLVIDRRMWVVLAGLGLAVLLSPHSMFGGNIVQVRLPAVLGCLGVGSLQDRVSRWTKIICAALLGSLLVYRTIIVTQNWLSYDQDYAELAAAIATVEPGSKIFLTQIEPTSGADYVKMLTYSHFLDLAGLQRSIFTPMMFAWPSQHPLRTTPAYRNLGASSLRQGVAIRAGDLSSLASGTDSPAAQRFSYLIRWQCHFNYVLSQYISDIGNPAPTLLEKWKTGKFFTFYKVRTDRYMCH
jgi:hypothetical protein